MRDETLQKLAGTLQELGEGDTSMPLEALVELGSMGLEGRLTVDFRAASTLGFPLVVYTPEPAKPAWWSALTPREQEVARLIASGLSNAGISARLGISLGTTKDHVHKVLAKSGLRRRAQVAALLA